MKHCCYFLTLAASLCFLQPVAAQFTMQQSSGIKRLRADQRQHRTEVYASGKLQAQRGDVMAQRRKSTDESLPRLRAPQMAEATGTELWGNVIYARSWEPEDVEPAYGVYAYSPEAGSNYVYARPVAVDDKLRANGSGTFYDGVYHFML